MRKLEYLKPRINAKEYTVKSNHGLHGLLTQKRKTRNISNTDSNFLRYIFQKNVTKT